MPKKKVVKKSARLKKKRLTRKPVKRKPQSFPKPENPEPSPEILATFDVLPRTDNRIPEKYHENRIALLVRDPWWLFAYWEFTEDLENHVMSQIRSRGQTREKLVLRVYDVTGSAVETAKSFFDIELNFFANNWYIDAGVPGREWVVELGIRTHEGGFFCLLRSNRAQTPPHGISDVLDEEWLLPDDLFFRLFGDLWLLEGRGDSLDIRKLVERYLRQQPSSEAAAKNLKITA